VQSFIGRRVFIDVNVLLLLLMLMLLRLMMAAFSRVFDEDDHWLRVGQHSTGPLQTPIS